MIGSAQRIRLVWLCAPGQRTQDDSAGAEEQCPLDRYADISAAATDVDGTDTPAAPVQRTVCVACAAR